MACAAARSACSSPPISGARARSSNAPDRRDHSRTTCRAGRTHRGRARGAARCRQDHSRASRVDRRAVAGGCKAGHARTAATRGACCGVVHGVDSGRRSRPDGGLPRAWRNAYLEAHAYRSGDRRRVGPHAEQRCGAGGHRPRDLRRVSRTVAAGRPGVGAGARNAAPSSRGAPCIGHVGDARWCGGGVVAGGRGWPGAGVAQRGPHVWHRDALSRAAS